MINKTTQYWSFRQSTQSSTDRSPHFLRRAAPSGKGADIVDISEAARMRMIEKNTTPLVKSIISFSRELGEMVRTTEGDFDASRAAMVEALRKRVREGSYDFDNARALEKAGDSLNNRKEIVNAGKDCA